MLTALRGGLAACVVTLPLLWATEWLAPYRSFVTLDQFAVTVLAFSLALVFLTPRAGKVGWPRLVMALLSLGVGLAASLGIESFALRMFSGDPDLVLLACGLILLCLVGCYLVTGWPMTLLVATFLLFGAVARFLPAPINAPPFELDTYVVYIAFGGDALVGQALRIVTVVVVVFVLFSRMFELMGGTEFFARLAIMASGKGPGGALKVAVVASGLFGSVNGSTTANVVSSGGFSIPMMRRIGVPAHQAAAIEAVASTGGQLMPPVMGIAAFLMVEVAGLPYREVIAAAFFPALLYFLSIFFQIDGLASRHGLPPSDQSRADWAEIGRDALRTAIPFALIVGTLILMPYAPGHGAVLASVACLALAATRKPLTTLFAEAARLTVLAGITAARIVVTGAVIGMLLGVVNYTGLGVAGALAIEGMASSQLYLALIAAAVACFFLGLGLATTAVYAVVGTLIAPSLVAFGLPVIAAHMFVFYCAMLSMITPPVAIACLAASGLAEASFWRTSFMAMRLGWSLFFLPFLFVINPELLLIGSGFEIATTVVCCLAGVIGISTVIGRLPIEREGLLWNALLAGLAVAALTHPLPLVVRVMAACALLVAFYKDRAQHPSVTS
ncbi:TRAP transporter fused permease subunit [Maritalea mobilis]|uniref:TRAP transporter permease n=1 Tax=Maritalea mobilis TaxID=483324 RepID=UPI001C967F89|nr:TRAP transporter fused permease subunit [Maritalea mobilis]MBY6202849.1 TRAP transporter fused permease subunit [Maritalea mobilis]